MRFLRALGGSGEPNLTTCQPCLLFSGTLLFCRLSVLFLPHSFLEKCVGADILLVWPGHRAADYLDLAKILRLAQFAKYTEIEKIRTVKHAALPVGKGEAKPVIRLDLH